MSIRARTARDEIVARRLDQALPGETIESALTPGLNALKTFDPPFSAIDGATFTGARRRGKLLLLDVDTPAHGPLTLLIHLMSAGRIQLFDKRASMEDRTSRVLFRLADDRELRVREFGTKQAAWVKLLRADWLTPTRRSTGLAPRRGRRRRMTSPSGSPPPRPLHSMLRDQRGSPASAARGSTRSCTRPGCRPSNAATTCPKRRSTPSRKPSPASSGAARRRRGAGPAPAAGEVPKPTRVHAHQGRAVPALRDGARGGVRRG